MAVPVTGPDLDPEDIQQPRVVLGAGALLYAVMTAVALGWLWVRDRLEILPGQAIGQHGPWLAAGLGLLIGWCGAMAFAVLARRVQKFRAYAAPTTSYVVIVDRTGRVAYTGTGGDQEFLGALRRVAAQ